MFIIALSFVLGFGVFSLGGLTDYIRQLSNQDQAGPRRAGELGRVGKKTITQSEYENLKNYHRAIFVENSKARTIPTQVEDEIAQRTWSYLVSDKALEDVYKNEKINLLFEEVLEILKLAPPREVVNDSAFYTDGKFDTKKYEQVLYTNRFLQMHFPSYRDFVRGSRLEADLKNCFRVPTGQVVYEQARDNVKFSINYLAFEPYSFAKNPDDKAIWAYYSAHKAAFAKPERRTMRYAVFPIRMTAEDTAAAKEQIDETYKTLASDEDFLYATDRYNDSTGMWFRTDSLDSVVRGAIADLPAGKNTEPVLTREGWQIVRLDERGKDSVRLRYITVPIEISSGTYSTIRDQIDNLTGRAKEENLDTLAKELGIELRDAPPLEKGKDYQLDPEISGSIETFAKFAKVGDFSQPMRTSRNDIYLFRLTGIQRGIASVMDSFEIRNKVSSKLVQDKARPLMEARARDILAKLKSGTSMEDVVKGDSQVRLQNRAQTPVTALTYIGPEFAGTVFGMKPGQTSGLVKTERGMYIIRCDDRQETPPMPNPYYAQTKLNSALTRVKDAITKTPRVVDYRNPFGL